MAKSVVSTSPEILNGTPVFAGTRVPIQSFIDYLEGGETIEEFLDDFPTVSRDQITALLRELIDDSSPPPSGSNQAVA